MKCLENGITRIKDTENIKVEKPGRRMDSTDRGISAYMNIHNNAAVQVDAIFKKFNYHLRSIGSIRRYWTSDIVNGAVVTIILSNIDYCKVLLGGGAAYQICRPQTIQNHAARLVTHSPPQCHITPSYSDGLAWAACVSPHTL